MINIKNLCKNYGSSVAIKDINLKVDALETAVILGPSGGGKSTLLRCINGLEAPSSGLVYVDKIEVNDKNLKRVNRKAGMVFQHFNLFNNMTVIENLMYAPRSLKLNTESEISKKAQGLVSDFNLDKVKLFYPNKLSGGQKQRAAICRALMVEPEIMLFDEPTSALDVEKVKDMINIILELKKKMTIVAVSHHVGFARAIADRIVFMDRGMILDDQKAQNFFVKPRSHRAEMFLNSVLK